MKSEPSSAATWDGLGELLLGERPPAARHHILALGFEAQGIRHQIRQHQFHLAKLFDDARFHDVSGSRKTRAYDAMSL